MLETEKFKFKDNHPPLLLNALKNIIESENDAAVKGLFATGTDYIEEILKIILFNSVEKTLGEVENASLEVLLEKGMAQFTGDLYEFFEELHNEMLRQKIHWKKNPEAEKLVLPLAKKLIAKWLIHGEKDLPAWFTLFYGKESLPTIEQGAASLLFD